MRGASVLAPLPQALPLSGGPAATASSTAPRRTARQRVRARLLALLAQAERWYGLLVVWILGFLQRTVVQAPPSAPPPLNDEQVLERLWRIVRREGIAVLPRGWMMWSQEVNSFGSACVGMCDLRRRIIWLRPDYYRNPWVLAHELGHDALRARPSHTEPEADAAGRALLLSELSPEEAEGLRWLIDIYLPASPRSERKSA